MRIDFHPGATEDLESSSDWYAQRSSTAARNFLVAVDLAITSISDDPERFSVLMNGIKLVVFATSHSKLCTDAKWIA